MALPMKGMSQTLWIVIVVIVALVVAIVVLSVFTGGVNNFLNIFNPWVNTTAGTASCQSACATLCYGDPNHGDGTPRGWPPPDIDQLCSDLNFKCVCSDVSPWGSGGPYRQGSGASGSSGSGNPSGYQSPSQGASGLIPPA